MNEVSYQVVTNHRKQEIVLIWEADQVNAINRLLTEKGKAS